MLRNGHESRSVDKLTQTGLPLGDAISRSRRHAVTRLRVRFSETSLGCVETLSISSFFLSAKFGTSSHERGHPRGSLVWRPPAFCKQQEALLSHRLTSGASL